MYPLEPPPGYFPLESRPGIVAAPRRIPAANPGYPSVSRILRTFWLLLRFLLAVEDVFSISGRGKNNSHRRASMSERSFLAMRCEGVDWGCGTRPEGSVR